MATKDININDLDIRLQNVEGEVKKFCGELHRIGSTVDLVYSLLNGNKLDETGGMVKKVNGLDTRVKALEDREKQDGWMNRLFWVGAGIIISQIITLIFKHIQ